MAQIIKHRRGSISALKDVTARVGELVMATGSIDNLNGPILFIGESEGIAGAFRPVSKIYQGITAPTITVGSYGSVIDGTPFYASGEKSLYVLSKDGNNKLDLTGNIEGNTISGVTINALTASFVSGAFIGDGSGLTNIPSSGVTGLNLSQISSGSYTASISELGGFRVNTDAAITGTIYVGDNTDSQIYNDGTLYVQDDTNGVSIKSNNYAQLESGNSYIWVEGNDANVEGNTYTRIYTNSGNVDISSYDGGTLNLNSDGSEGDINVLNGSNKININGNSNFTGSVNIDGDTSITGALVVADGSATFDQGLVAQNSNMLLTSGSNLVVQNNGNVQVDYIRGNTNEWNYLALNGGVLGAPGVELSSAGNISLWDEGGTVNVTGSLVVSGDIVFSGSINIGDYTGDTVNFQGEISSSIIPQTNNAFSLGASGQTWSDVWAENAHFNNIILNTISFSGLTEGRSVFVGQNGSLVDNSNYTYDSGSNTLSVGKINTTNNDGVNVTIGIGVNISDVDEFNAFRISGYDNSSYTKMYLNGENTNNQLEANYNDVTLQSNNQLYLKSQNGSVNLESYDGNIYLNSDSGNNITLDGNTYFNTNKTMYVSNMRDNNDNVNYMQLYGWNTDDGFWWESGTGRDSTLYNDENANINILARSGKVNIDGNDTVNLHSVNGFNVTGSMVVSDGSGVFNSSLVVNNSDLTVENGSNVQMNDGAHLYFNNGCGDIYYNNGSDQLTIYNDCGNVRIDNELRVSNDLYVEGNNVYSDNYSAYDGNQNNTLHLNGGTFGASEVELTSVGQISLFSEGSNSNFAINMTGSVYMSNDLTVSGTTNISDLTVHNNLYVSGNLEVLGSATNVNIQSSTVEIGDNIILVNAYSPFQRYAGMAAYDSGSSGASGSLLWDSLNDYWLFVSASGQSSKVIGTTAGTYGSENSLTSGTIPIATGANTIGDSLLTYSNTTLSFNSGKFTVNSSSGDTLIDGNVTINGAGGDDLGDGSSFVTFRNDDGILGFVSSTDTELVSTQILGYNESTGVLQFSSVIDGGVY